MYTGNTINGLIDLPIYSVLISLYSKERPDYLRLSLESIFHQSLPPNEVILVEDGPLTNELYAVLDEYECSYSQLKRIPLAINGGLGKALNEGLKHCSNELVARMDSDDVCFPNRFEKQVKFMTENPDIDISGTWIEEFENDIENKVSIRKVPITHEEIARYIGKRNPLNHPSVIFRKEAVLKAGSYQSFLLFEDWYLWARMMVNGCRFANIPECLLHFRTSLDVMSRRGGMKYAKSSFRFQKELHRLGLISGFDAVKNGIMRGVVYLLPNRLRALVYFKLLRSK